MRDMPQTVRKALPMAGFMDDPLEPHNHLKIQKNFDIIYSESEGMTMPRRLYGRYAESIDSRRRATYDYHDAPCSERARQYYQDQTDKAVKEAVDVTTTIYENCLRRVKNDRDYYQGKCIEQFEELTTLRKRVSELEWELSQSQHQLDLAERHIMNTPTIDTKDNESSSDFDASSLSEWF